MKPYSVNVPVPLKMLTPENRVKYLKTLKRTVADRIFISISHLSDCGSIDWELLADNIRYFSENGIEAAVWFGETLGHGCCISGIGTPKDEPAIRNFTKIHGITGEENRFSFCPLDDGFADFFADNVKKAAATGTKLIILDDDFRLSLRDYGIGCACPLHMKKISALLGGEEITHGTLTKYVIHGSPNRYRDAWLKAQGDSLRSLASKLRAACDGIDPTVRMGIMDCYTLWDVDGVTAAELSTILAGSAGKPFIRVSGAPYWGSRRDPDLPGVFEITSLHMAFLPEDHGGEYIGEGDVYPSPRYNCPAAYQDIHDAFLRAEGSLDGDLKFMINYTSLPGYETGYEEKHIRNAEKLKSFGKFFADGKRTGVRIYEYRDKMKTADFPEPGFDALSVLSRYPYPHGGIMTASAGISTVYKGSAACGVLFGENARHIDINELGNGLVLDASAALILKERGIDTGIEEPNSFVPGSVSAEVFGKDGLTVVINDGGARLLTAGLSASAVIESTGNTSLGTIPLSYRYENAEGQKFLVYLFDSLELSRTTGLFFTYARKEQLISAFEWISGAQLPVVPENRAPFVYLLTKETDRGLAVGVFNCFADEVLSPSFRVSEIFTEVDFGSHTEKINNRTVTVDCDIPPFGYIAFTLR